MALKAGSVTDQNPGHDCPRGTDRRATRNFRSCWTTRAVHPYPVTEETHIGSGLELRVVPGTLLLILGEDIPGLVAVTPASAAAARSIYAMNRPGGSQRGREPRLRDQCRWRGRRRFI